MAKSAFFSYVHRDDEDDHAGITRLHERLAAEWSLQAGDDRLVWMDRRNLQWGTDWEEAIDQALLETSFFIPIVTPRYFRSDSCRKELLTFAAAARRLGLEELVMPIYYVSVPEFDSSDDEAIALVRRFQWEDWRNIRTANVRGSIYRTGLAVLGSNLLRAETSADSKPTPASLEPQDRDDVGDDASSDESPPLMLDILATGEAALNRVSPRVQQMAEVVGQVGELFTNATERLARSDQQGRGFAGRLTVSKRLAGQLAPHANGMEILTKDYVADVLEVDAMVHQMFRQASALSVDDRAELATFFQSLIDLDATIEEGISSAASFADVLAEGKDWSKDLRGPISRLEIAVRQFIDTREFFRRWSQLARQHLDAVNEEVADA